MKLSMSSSQSRRAIQIALALAIGGTATGLSGCGAFVADLPLVGLPSDAPPRKPRGSFMPVNDLPGQRESAKLEAAEEARIRSELAAARDQQAAAAAAAAK